MLATNWVESLMGWCAESNLVPRLTRGIRLRPAHRAIGLVLSAAELLLRVVVGYTILFVVVAIPILLATAAVLGLRQLFS